MQNRFPNLQDPRQIDFAIQALTQEVKELRIALLDQVAAQADISDGINQSKSRISVLDQQIKVLNEVKAFHWLPSFFC